MDSQSDDRRRVASTACSRLPIDDMLLLNVVGTRVDDGTYGCALVGGGQEDKNVEQ